MAQAGKRKAAAVLGTLALLGPGLAALSATPAFAQAGPVKAAAAGSIQQAAAARLAAVGAHAQGVHPDLMHPDTTVSLAEDSKLNCLGVAGGAEAKFNDGVISYGATSGQIYGDSWGYWWGKSPANASTLTLTDTYSISGVATSWNGPGSGFKTISGDKISYTVSQNNVRTYHHGEYEVQFGGFATSFAQTTSVDLQFPGTACTPSASGTKYM
ncbi:hypothetical protein [Streptacidiphilus melanogenes]|uniref:hypothetical protein n=1 Tax=Streptacidiphilus melanogenes TaxID=411235 RepID=UPI0005A9C94A|nr:hypothetical protein [Streptacidiphilus melanogenes]